MVASPHPLVRKAVAEALEGMGSRQSEASLTELLYDDDASVASAVAHALVALGAGTASRDLFLFLAKHPDRPTLESLLRMEGVDIAQECRVALPGVNPEAALFRRLCIICEAVEGLRPLQFPAARTPTLRARVDPYLRFKAEARRVNPMRGSRSMAWANAPEARNGGRLSSLQRDSLVEVRDAVFYQGETWLKVYDASPDGELWSRERELRSIGPQELMAGK